MSGALVLRAPARAVRYVRRHEEACSSPAPHVVTGVIMHLGMRVSSLQKTFVTLSRYAGIAQRWLEASVMFNKRFWF